MVEKAIFHQFFTNKKRRAEFCVRPAWIVKFLFGGYRVCCRMDSSTASRRRILAAIADALGVSIAVLDDRLLNSLPVLPNDDLFKIILKNWSNLTNEQRGKLAADSITMAEKNQSVPPSSISSEAKKKRA